MSDDKRQEAEQRYITGKETLAEIAAGMGLPLSSIKRWCKSGDWVKKREKYRKKVMRKAVNRASDKKARDVARLLEASEEMERTLLILARDMRIKAEEGNADMKQSKYFLNVAWSLEKMANVRHMTGGAMTAAEKEKLALLREKQEQETAKGKEDARIELAADMEEISV